MADLNQLETALINADKAGDTEAAKMLAGEITRLRAPKVEQKQTDPTGSFGENLLAGAGKGFVDLGRRAKQLVAGSPNVDPNLFIGTAMPQGPEREALAKQIQQERQASISSIQGDIDEAKRLDAPLMKTSGGITGNIGTNLAIAAPTALIPGANTLTGSTLIGAGMGLLQPVATGESGLLNTAVGGALGAAGYGIGALANKTVKGAQAKVASIENDIAQKAAATAASETASARSAAGNAAQNAYRQLEHLRELGAMRALSPEEAQVAAQLEKELAGKAMEKLLPAAAEKELTAAAYKEAIKTESERAAKMFSDKLGNNEIKSQVMARLKRYGPAAVGGAIGHFLIPGLGTAGGAATGLVLRPAVRSMMNLAKNPAVQHGLLSPVAGMGLLANEAIPQTLGLLAPSVYFATNQ